MPVELIAGQAKELNVQMVPVAGPPGSHPEIQHLHLIDRPISADAARFVLYCPITNMGTEAGTHTLTSSRLLYDVFPEPELKQHTQQFTVAPGETYLYRVADTWARFARAEFWIVGDWGEETPKMLAYLGYYHDHPEARVIATRRGADHATLQYSQQSECNDWTWTVHTPVAGPDYEQFIKFRFRMLNDPIARSWTAMHTTVWPLISQRTYRAHCRGGATGSAWRAGETEFTTRE